MARALFFNRNRSRFRRFIELFHGYRQIESAYQRLGSMMSGYGKQHLIAGARNPDLVVLFRARRHLCAIPVAHALETMRPLPITPLAAMPAFVLGLSLISGVAIPVVDTGFILGAEDAPNTTRFITLRLDGRCVALAVEAVLGVREIAPDSLQRLPPLLRDASIEVVSSIGTLDAEFLLVLRAARLLTEAVESTLDLQEA